MDRMRGFSHAFLLGVSSVAGFSAAPRASALRPHAELGSIRMMEQIPRPDAERFPFRTVVLGLLSVQSAFGLTADNELGGLLTRLGDPTLPINYFSTFFDSAFFAYGANTLLNQAGVIKESPKSSGFSLSDLEAQITLSIGREQGTWMPQEWAASGARLSLPMRELPVHACACESRPRLQPCGSQRATVWAPGCNRMCPVLQPCAVSSVPPGACASRTKPWTWASQARRRSTRAAAATARR